MPAKKTTSKSNVWTDEERAAMQEAVRDKKRSSGRDPEAQRAEGEREVLAKIAELPEPDRGMAQKIHAIVSSVAPSLVPRTFYGMPAYARDGKVVCFFKPASKFKERYATFGFEAGARLDQGTMWPTSWAMTGLTAADGKALAELVKRSLG
ncbi:MAG TPA: DUF1801 domain-containing protein [Candidatus Limnocylindria bacterium]